MKIKTLFLATSMALTSNLQAAENTIDVAFYYTEEIAQKLNGNINTFIDNQVQTANKAFADSGVKAKLVAKVKKATTGKLDVTDENYTKLSTAWTNDGVNAIYASKKQLNVDYIVIIGKGTEKIVKYKDDEGKEKEKKGMLCGKARIATQDIEAKPAIKARTADLNTSFTLIAGDCKLSKVLVHELGHSLGLAHPTNMKIGAGKTALTDSAFGFGQDDGAVTIMGYTQEYKNGKEVLQFSKNNAKHEGHAIGNSKADAVTTIRETAVQLANLIAK